MNSPSTEAMRELIEENCTFLEGFSTEYGYLQLPSELLTTTAQAVAQVRERLKTDALQLALVGGFSSGKSTLINAMLDDTLLASRVSPTTVCPTYISYGSKKEIVIKLKTMPRGADTLSSPLPQAVWIKANFIPGGAAQMSTSSGVEYTLTHEFRRRGFYEYSVVLDNLPAVSRRICVPRANMQVVMRYNILTNTTATSLDCSAIEDAQLPMVRHSSALDYPATTLRDIWLDMQWEAVVEVRASAGKAYLDFDSDWFDSNHPVQYVPREIGSALQRFLVWLQPSFGYRRVASNSKQCPRSVWTHQGASSLLVRLDLRENTFTAHELPQTPFVTRILRLPEGPSSGSKIIGTLTAAARANSDEKDYSDVIHSVVVHHPSDLLQRRLVLIDTPGIAADSVHTMKTVDIIEREADACLFLLPAEQAGTLSDLDFVKEHVMSNVGDIIFVLTKADKADSPEELDELVDIVQSKVRDKLGLSSCMVLAVSAKEALADRDSEARSRFRSFVNEVSSFAERNRDLIMAKRLLSVEASIMHRLREAADRARAEYEFEQKRLQSYAIENLGSFIEREREGVFSRFDMAFDPERYEVRMEMALIGVVKRARSEANRIISGAGNMKQLKEVCETDLRSCLGRMNAVLMNEYRHQLEALDEPMQQLVQTAFADFERSFEEQYPLRKLTGCHISVDVGQNLRGLSCADTREQVAAVAEAIYSGKSAGETGAALGAIVGTMLLPGVGSVVGGALGYFASKLFGPSLADVKASVATDVEKELDHLIMTIIPSSVAELMTELRANLLSALEAGINDYVRQYTNTVNNLIKEHAKKKKQVEVFIQQSKGVAADLDRRISELEAVKAGCYAQ